MDEGLTSEKQITELQNCSVSNRTCIGMLMTAKIPTETDQGISVPTSI